MDEDQVAAILQHRGLLVTSIRPKDQVSGGTGAGLSRSRAAKLHGRVTTEDRVLLCQQLATLSEAGIPLLKSLEVVSAQVESRRLLLALDDIRRRIQAGSTFREALVRHPAVFSKLWLNLIGTGESSGHLADSLKQLARHFESERQLKSAATTAMTYPAFLMCAVVLVLTAFVYFIIPKFTIVFASSQMPLPPLTQFVIGMSRGARRYWFLIIPGAIGLVYGLYQYILTPGGSWVKDRVLLRLPVFGTLFVNIQLAEFTRGLSTLLESGVPLLSTLEILADSATNRVYGQAITQIQESVKEGKSMSHMMDETGVFPPMVIQMTLVGEEVGELAKMADRLATYYQERIQVYIDRMTRLFEPIAIVIVAGVVLIVVLSIFMPIFQMAGGFK